MAKFFPENGSLFRDVVCSRHLRWLKNEEKKHLVGRNFLSTVQANWIFTGKDVHIAWKMITNVVCNLQSGINIAV
jgi:hypothetical protein